MSVYNKKNEVVKVLLEKGADVNPVNKVSNIATTADHVAEVLACGDDSDSRSDKADDFDHTIEIDFNEYRVPWYRTMQYTSTTSYSNTRKI